MPFVYTFADANIYPTISQNIKTTRVSIFYFIMTSSFLFTSSQKNPQAHLYNSFYTDLPLNSKLKLKPIKNPSFYKYHFFIYDNQRYVVEIVGINDDEIFFKDIYGDGQIGISLQAIYELCDVKVIG